MLESTIRCVPVGHLGHDLKKAMDIGQGERASACWILQAIPAVFDTIERGMLPGHIFKMWIGSTISWWRCSFLEDSFISYCWRKTGLHLDLWNPSMLRSIPNAI